MPDPNSQPEEKSEVTFSCPNCTQHLAVHESYRGEQVPCPTCGEQVIVPPVAAPPPLPVAPPARPASPPPVSSSGLRDSIIRAQTSDQKARLIIQNRDEIRRAFPEWLTIPDEYLKTEAGRKSYSEILIVIAVVFAQNFSDSSLLKHMKPPAEGDKKTKWKFW